MIYCAWIHIQYEKKSINRETKEGDSPRVKSQTTYWDQGQIKQMCWHSASKVITITTNKMMFYKSKYLLECRTKHMNYSFYWQEKILWE